MSQLHDTLQQISSTLNERTDWNREDRKYIEDRLSDLQRRVSRFRSTDEYVTHIEASLGRAQAIRSEDAAPQTEATTDVTDWEGIDSVDSVDWRRVPLCGCCSPTCDLKRGKFPAACKDRSAGLLDDRSAAARVRAHMQSHTQPYILRVAHQTWVNQYSDLLGDCQELLSEVVRERPTDGNRSTKTTHSR